MNGWRNIAISLIFAAAGEFECNRLVSTGTQTLIDATTCSPYSSFVIEDSLRELYSAKSDEELLALAADSASLREDARSVLTQELQRRNLQEPPNSHTVKSRPARPITRTLAFVGAMMLNTGIALFCTPLLEAGIQRMFQPQSFAAMLWKWWILDIVCAAGLGFSISRVWKNKSQAWTWVIPVFWFALRFVPAALSGRNRSVLVGQSVWSQFSGSDCIGGLQSLGCENFFLFTLPLLRGISYSLGAVVPILNSRAKQVPRVTTSTSR